MPEIPDRHRVSLLLAEYFANVHPLRSFGFIHKPSFMQGLDDRLYNRSEPDILVHVLCAAGATFYALKHADEEQLAAGFASYAGTQWAEQGASFLFGDLNRVSVERAMVSTYQGSALNLQ